MSEAEVHTEQTARLHDEIEQTRGELGDTVQALAAKTDVKAQAKHKVEEIKGKVSEKTGQLKDKAQAVTPEHAQSSASQLPATAREHPLVLGLATGLLAGYLIGRTRR